MPKFSRIFSYPNFQVGFRWALRISGFIVLLMTAGAATMVKGRLSPRTDPEFFAFSLFRQPPYTFFWWVGLSDNVK